MVEFAKNIESSSKTKPSFNRSFTIHGIPAESTSKPAVINGTASILKFSGIQSLEKSMKGKVKNLCKLFDPPKPEPGESQLQHRKLKHSKSSCGIESGIRLPGTEDRIVVYLTSLRGIRRTYEDCYAVQTILRGFRVMVDERDVSMDAGYRKELQRVMKQKSVSLPQVFIRGKHVGGGDVIKSWFEIGELAKILQGFPVRENGLACRSCGEARFVPCGNCSGSKKVFDEDEEVSRRCLDCNENGLIRCPDCFF